MQTRRQGQLPRGALPPQRQRAPLPLTQGQQFARTPLVPQQRDLTTSHRGQIEQWGWPRIMAQTLKWNKGAHAASEPGKGIPTPADKHSPAARTLCLGEEVPRAQGPCLCSKVETQSRMCGCLSQREADWLCLIATRPTQGCTEDGLANAVSGNRAISLVPMDRDLAGADLLAGWGAGLGRPGGMVQHLPRAKLPGC